MKRVISLLVAVVLIVALSGCGKDTVNDISGPKGTDVVMTVNGIEISADFYRYILVGTAMENVGDISAADWSSETLAGEISQKITDTIKARAALLAYADEKNITLSSEELESIDSMVNDYIERNGKSDFLNQLKMMGISSEEGFRETYKKELLTSKALEEIVANPLECIPEDIDISQYQEPERVSVKHILIMNSSTAHENPEDTINEVLSLANAGEDFDKLVEKYNEDPGQTAMGYTFGPGEMVKEFEDASFALDINEISGVVESSYGYHIIKRIVGETEIVNYLTSTVEEPETTEKINEFILSDIMQDVNDAINASNAESEAK